MSYRSDSKSLPNLFGRRLGRYQVLGHVAGGGMATVHVARAEGTFGFERWVAVKVLHPHLASEDELATMFVDEARMAARIRHPKVVSVLDVADDPSEGLYIVMDYVEGDHLGALLKSVALSRTPLPPRVALRIVLDLLEGLEAAHELTDERGARTPIIHRDVTPHNLLVGVDGVMRLTDFGIARAEARITQTREGQFKGKLSYMAPEQLTEGGASVRSDLFSAGIVAYECLTATRLFRGDTTAETLQKILNAPIPHVDRDRPELAPVAGVIARALAREPDERFESAREMASAIAHAASAMDGIAQPREVGEIVRKLRGEMLAERAMRLRIAAEQLGSNADVTVTSKGRPVETVGPRASQESIAPVVAPSPRAGTRIKVLAVAAIIGAVLALGLALGADQRLASATLALRGDGTAAQRPDGPPVLREGLIPLTPTRDVALSPTVLVRLRIAVDGTVKNAEIVGSREDLRAFEEIAIAAALGYRFHPALRGGTAVEATLELPIRFSREDGPEHVVRIKGSDTIGGALAPALAAAFRTVRPDIRVEVEALGSATAFVGLFDGTADLGASSRPIKPAELEEARRLGLVLEENVIGYDGIAIVGHPSNAIQAISLDAVAQLFAGRVHDVATLGGPHGRPHLVGRPSYSGTHSFFADRILKTRDLEFADDVTEVEQSNALIALVAQDPLALGYVGASYLDPSVRALPVLPESGGRGVLPSEATIQNGSHPIYRPLLCYSRGAPSGAVLEFLTFVLSPRGRAIVRAHGFVPSEVSLGAGEAGAARGDAPRRTERITFAMGQTRAPAEAAATIQRVLAQALANEGARVVITGHADSEGTEEENVRLGLSRARSIADTLERHGVARERLDVSSRGSTAPVATNGTSAGRDANRRVDVLVLP